MKEGCQISAEPEKAGQNRYFFGRSGYLWGAAISILFVAATFCFTSTANAASLHLNFLAVGNDLGAALENAGDDFTGTEAGITFVASATGPDDAVPDAASSTSGLGVNSI